MLLYFYIALTVLILYGLLILLFTFGWYKAVTKVVEPGSGNTYEPNITVVIPFKDEEPLLGPLLRSFMKLTYDHATFLFVDDHSVDQGPACIEKWMQQDDRIHLLHLPNNLKGKKEAVKMGVEYACTEIIVTTDADCSLPMNWLSSMVMPFRNEQVQMVAGPVTGNDSNTIIGKFALLDLLSLVGTALGSIAIGLSMYCNAANMAFRKPVFERYVQSKLGMQSDSGDDVFLLHFIKAHYKKGAIQTVVNRDCLVTTSLPESINAFFMQRMRWASKGKFYKDGFTIFTGLLVYVTNLLLTLALFLALVTAYWQVFILFLGLKTMIDTIFFAVILGFFKKHYLLPLSIVYQGIYFLYISFLVPVSALRNTIRWKE